MERPLEWGLEAGEKVGRGEDSQGTVEMEPEGGHVRVAEGCRGGGRGGAQVSGWRAAGGVQTMRVGRCEQGGMGRRRRCRKAVWGGACRGGLGVRGVAASPRRRRTDPRSQSRQTTRGHLDFGPRMQWALAEGIGVASRTGALGKRLRQRPRLMRRSVSASSWALSPV